MCAEGQGGPFGRDVRGNPDGHRLSDDRDRWVEWSMRLQAIAQAGRTYSTNGYDLDRYRQLQDLAAEIMAEHSEHTFAEARRFLEEQSGYPTPKVDVRGVVLEADRVLLVRETTDGRWSLPGGWADVLLTASENAVKEIREESGYECVARRLLAVYDRGRHNPTRGPNPLSIYKIFFLCERVGGAAATSIETSDADFFPLSDLPALSLGRVTPQQIHRMAELASSGDVDFD